MSLNELPLTQFAGADLYVGGASDGLPNKVAPSDGLKQSGFVPGTKLPFPRLNYLLNQAGEAGAWLIDAPAFDWTPQLADADAQYVDHTPATKPIMLATQHWLVVDCDLSGHGKFSAHHLGKGLNIAQDETVGVEWARGLQVTGIGDNATTMHYAGNESPADVLFHKTDDGTVKVLSFGAGFTFPTSDGGTALPGGGAVSMNCGSRLDGYWFLHWQVTTASHFMYSSSLSGAWTEPAAFTRSESPGAFCSIARGPANYVLFNASATTCLVNEGGAGGSFVERALGGSALHWEGAYNPIIQKFMAIGHDGAFGNRIVVAEPDAATWTSISVPPLTYGFRYITAFARGFIISVGTALAYIAQKADETWYARFLPMITPGVSGEDFALTTQNGRAIALRIAHPSGDDRRIEWWKSGVSPFMLDAGNGVGYVP